MTKTQKILTISQLRNDLLTAYTELREGTLDYSEAKELANMAGKIIKSANVQLNYNEYMKTNDPILFLQGE